MDTECLQQVKDFKYVGCEISYEKRKDLQHKLAKFALDTGNFKNFLKPICVQKSSKNYIAYNALAVPILLNERENWTLRQKNK
jgi:hypothetical protein